MEPIIDKYIFDLGQEVKEGLSLNLWLLYEVEGEGMVVFENLNVPFLVFIFLYMPCKAVVISKNSNKGGFRWQPHPHFRCGLAAATPIFLKLRYDNLI